MIDFREYTQIRIKQRKNQLTEAEWVSFLHSIYNLTMQDSSAKRDLLDAIRSFAPGVLPSLWGTILKGGLRDASGKPTPVGYMHELKLFTAILHNWTTRHLMSLVLPHMGSKVIVKINGEQLQTPMQRVAWPEEPQDLRFAASATELHVDFGRHGGRFKAVSPTQPHASLPVRRAPVSPPGTRHRALARPRQAGGHARQGHRR